MSSDAIGPLCLGVFILAVVGDALGGGHRAPPQTVNPVPVAASTEQTQVWDERSDCYPGAPPNSLANAIDVLHAHCDRAAAVARIAPLAIAALPLLGEAAVAEAGAAEGAAASDVAAGASLAGDMRAAGAAADSVATSEAGAEGAGQVSRTYRMSSTGRNAYQATPEDAAGRDSYQVERVGRENYEVASPATGRTYPTNVRRVGEDEYEVEGSDGSLWRVTTRQLDRWYAGTSPTEQIWEYQKR